MTLESKYEYRSYPMSEFSAGEGHEVRCDFLSIKTTNPYERGYIQGQLLQEKIRLIYDEGMEMVKKICQYHMGTEVPDMKDSARQIINNSEKETIEELRGVAAGAHMPLDDILILNAIPIIFASFMGCTGLAARVTTSNTEGVSADNTPGDTVSFDSPYRRFREVRKAFNESKSYHSALESVNMRATIRSKVFDPANCSIDIAMGMQYAAVLPFHHFNREMLFGSDRTKPQEAAVSNSAKSTFCLAHNVDFCGGSTGVYNLFADTQLILVREHANGMKTVSLTFPGLIGINDGMNSQGVSISVLTQNMIRKPSYLDGEHNHFAHYELLSRSTTASIFKEGLKQRCLSAPMSLIGCDTLTAFSLEWYKDDDPSTKGWDYSQPLS